jgi:hypothetical protein
MSDDYAGDANSFPSTITTVSDDDVIRAGAISVPLEQLADRTAAIVPKTTILTSNATWTKDPLALFVDFVVVGAGGNGGEGSTTGGGGGGSGGVTQARLPAALVPTTLYSRFTPLAVFLKKVNDNDIVAGDDFVLRALNGADGEDGSTGGAGGVGGETDAPVVDGTGTVMIYGHPGTNGGSGVGFGGRGGAGIGAYSWSEAAADEGGLGGSGYGAGGGGGAGASPGGDGGGGGASGYGHKTPVIGHDGGAGGGSNAGGVGDPGAVIITQWCGVAL